jgi:hypothetical protein
METLARTLRESSVAARRRDRDASAAVGHLGEELQLLTDDLVQVRTEGHADDARAYREATKQLVEAQREAEAAQVAHEQLVTSIGLHTTLESSLENLPELLSNYAEALASYQDAENAVAAADKALTETGRKQKVDADKTKQINWLLGRLPHRMRHLANAQVEEQRAHARIGVTEHMSLGEIRARSRDIDQKIKELEEENRSADLAGTVRDAQVTIESELRSMPRKAQNERIATVGRDIRVHELTEGIAARRKQLEGVPKPDEVAKRERTIQQLRAVRMWLGALPDLYKKTEQKQQLVDDGSAELAALRGDAADGDALTEANKAAAVARGELMVAAVTVRECQAAIDSAIGLDTDPDEPAGVEEAAETADGDEDNDADDTELPVPHTVEEVEASIAGWLGGLEEGLEDRCKSRWSRAIVGPGSLSARIEQGHSVVAEMVATLTTDLETAELHRQDAASEASAAVVTQERAEEAVGNRLERLGIALRTLHDDAGHWAEYHPSLDAVAKKCGLPWESFNDLALSAPALTDLLEEDDPRGTAIATATKVVETVAEIAAELESAAARVRDQWSNAANYLHKFSGDLSARLDDHPFDAKSMRASAGNVLTKWAERSISDLLSSPELRAELFDNSASVAFNISDLTVSWTERDTKRRRRRPLEAFSSGEQVFAYTKAKLERLRGLHSKAENVVVFLDEFGAFVARDRFAQLVTYIQHDALGSIADQIVVTVPLSGELEQVRDNASLASIEAELYEPPGYVVIPARVD